MYILYPFFICYTLNVFAILCTSLLILCNTYIYIYIFICSVIYSVFSQYNLYIRYHIHIWLYIIFIYNICCMLSTAFFDYIS